MLRALAAAQRALMEPSIAVARLLVAVDVAEDAAGVPDEVAELTRKAPRAPSMPKTLRVKLLPLLTAHQRMHQSKLTHSPRL